MAGAQSQPQPKKANPRVREHVDKLREAGLDTQKFFDALCAIRDDSALSKTHREALYKLIASESFVWYLEALRNERIDRLKLKDEARRIAEEHGAAIKKRSPGDQANALANADIGAAPAKPAAPRPPATPRKK